MEEKISKILKSARVIEASSEFKERSARLILSSRQNQPTAKVLSGAFGWRFSLGLAGVLAVFVLVFLIYQGFLFKNGSANGHELLSEAAKIDFQIHLGEAQYFEDSSKDIAALLKIIGDLDGNAN